MPARDVGAIARLASIRLSKEEEAFMGQELNAVMDWIDQLNEVDVSDITLHVAATSMPERPDVATEGNHREEVLANAPEAVEQWFAVPKMIKQG